MSPSEKQAKGRCTSGGVDAAGNRWRREQACNNSRISGAKPDYAKKDRVKTYLTQEQSTAPREGFLPEALLDFD